MRCHHFTLYKSSYTIALLCFFISGCVNIYPPSNKPIQNVTEQGGYRPGTKELPLFSGDHHILLAFSGGGTRAAALSYGVMQELHETTILTEGKQQPLINEVDTISAVSGGSFTAAYYGVFGDKLFEDFESDFLRQDIQSNLVNRLFNPGHWFKSLFSGFDRTEMAVDYYDRTIFKGATFADMNSPGKPFIRINATDLGIGMRFNFTQGIFDLLCSDINSFSVARAVTASSAIPVVFPSVVLENHASECDFELSDQWAALNRIAADGTGQVEFLADLKSYRDNVNRPYIHLVDGGISDNLGLRVLIESLDNVEEISYQRLAATPPRSILVILVNAETKPDRLIEKTAKKPSVGATIRAVSSAQISRYNIETRANLKHKIKSLSEYTQENNLKTKIYYSEVSFSAIPSEQAGSFFNNLPTSLELSDEEVDNLIASARLLLRHEPEYKRFISENNGATTSQAPDNHELCEAIDSFHCAE